MRGYRKIVAASMSVTLATVLLVFGFIDGPTWNTFSLGVLGLFMATNTVGKFSASKD